MRLPPATHRSIEVPRADFDGTVMRDFDATCRLVWSRAGGVACTQRLEPCFAEWIAYSLSTSLLQLQRVAHAYIRHQLCRSSCHIASMLFDHLGQHWVEPCGGASTCQREICKGDSCGRSRRMAWFNGVQGRSSPNICTSHRNCTGRARSDSLTTPQPARKLAFDRGTKQVRCANPASGSNRSSDAGYYRRRCDSQRLNR
jgi:hypothetical protein